MLHPDFLLAAGALMVAGLVALSLDLPKVVYMDADQAHKSLTDVFVAHERHKAAVIAAELKKKELAAAELDVNAAATSKAMALAGHIDAVTRAVN